MQVVRTWGGGCVQCARWRGGTRRDLRRQFIHDSVCVLSPNLSEILMWESAENETRPLCCSKLKWTWSAPSSRIKLLLKHTGVRRRVHALAPSQLTYKRPINTDWDHKLNKSLDSKPGNIEIHKTRTSTNQKEERERLNEKCRLTKHNKAHSNEQVETIIRRYGWGGAKTALDTKTVEKPGSKWRSLMTLFIHQHLTQAFQVHISKVARFSWNKHIWDGVFQSLPD